MPKLTTAADVKTAVRAWLDADDATHWGTFETALDAAINETPERALIVAMLRADAATMRANADAYSEEAPTDARALHEVAATLGFKAAQIERGDHLDAALKPQDCEAATFQAIHEAMMDERDGKPCGCIIERGCEAAGYHDPESAADAFKAEAVKRVLALAAPAPSCAPGEVDAATAVIRAHAARLGVKAITIATDTAALSAGAGREGGVAVDRQRSACRFMVHCRWRWAGSPYTDEVVRTCRRLGSGCGHAGGLGQSGGRLQPPAVLVCDPRPFRHPLAAAGRGYGRADRSVSHQSRFASGNRPGAFVQHRASPARA
ncbi:hypothetical protein FHS97_001718 [Sphingomonas endophytica]|uniref:DUF222 domain-containing protein n=1 Tax=Sphingomonas endophytica TaxID=869719 RepID=A0ABR6N6W9_9SPHN|nr:hypothetical protein [Sphingomonas endophytica]MBB5725786.1 hypothetical protein [Sphingomonas endophytica]